MDATSQVIQEYDVNEPEYKEIVLEVKPVGIMLPVMIACGVGAAYCFFMGE